VLFPYIIDKFWVVTLWVLCFTCEFRRFTREIRAFTREFRRFTREFGAFTREFGAFTRKHIFPTTQKKKRHNGTSFFEIKAIPMRPSSSGPLLELLHGLH
jgi:hypothetical protein